MDEGNSKMEDCLRSFLGYKLWSMSMKTASLGRLMAKR